MAQPTHVTDEIHSCFSVRQWLFSWGREQGFKPCWYCGTVTTGGFWSQTAMRSNHWFIRSLKCVLPRNLGIFCFDVGTCPPVGEHEVIVGYMRSKTGTNDTSIYWHKIKRLEIFSMCLWMTLLLFHISGLVMGITNSTFGLWDTQNCSYPEVDIQLAAGSHRAKLNRWESATNSHWR